MNEKTTQTQGVNTRRDSQAFAEALKTADPSSPAGLELAEHFADEMYKAIRGRIATPQRMAALYPIFREINLETDEINAYDARMEAEETSASPV